MSDSNIKSYALMIGGVILCNSGHPVFGIICVAIGIFL